jgi:phosphoribosyl-AMP cyclohydrolase
MSQSDRPTSPDFAKCGGILPVVVQDRASGAVLMLAYMNQEAYRQTLASGRGVYFSRSRNKLWYKGEESGHVQWVREVYVDCDRDAILLKVDQTGAACHEGYSSCFYRRLTEEGFEVVEERVFDPADVYPRGDRQE